MFGWFKKKTPLKEAFKKAEEYVQDKATEAAVEAIITEVKQTQKPKHIDCECKECIKRIKQNAK